MYNVYYQEEFAFHLKMRLLRIFNLQVPCSLREVSICARLSLSVLKKI